MWDSVYIYKCHIIDFKFKIGKEVTKAITINDGHDDIEVSLYNR